MKKMGLLFIFLGSVTFAQTIDVIAHQPLRAMPAGEFAFPQFSPDGSQLLFTRPGFSGLWLGDLENASVAQLNDIPGAGYEPLFSEDGKEICFRADEFTGIRKYSTLRKQNLATREIAILTDRERLVSPPMRMHQDRVFYSVDNRVRTFAPQTNGAKSTAAPQQNTVFAYVENSNERIIVYQNGRSRAITPLSQTGREQYLWASASPDGQRLLFTIAGSGSFITDLDGNLLAELGRTEAPKWSPDGKWIVFMITADDGHFYTAADIWAVTSDGKTRVQLTDTSDKLEMHPAWSPDMKRVAYDTLAGTIEIMEVEIND